MVITIIVYTVYLLNIICRQLPQSSLATGYAYKMLQVLTRKLESHMKQTLLPEINLNVFFSCINFYSKLRLAVLNSDMNSVVAILKKCP